MLNLTNVKVGALNAYSGSWPDKVELTGFTYGRLGGFSKESEKMDIAGPGSRWYEEILMKQENPSPQPYEQLGAVLRMEGYEDRAREILYLGKCRAFDKTDIGWRWLMMLFEENLIGYGYYNWLILVWTALFVITGALVLQVSGEAARHPKEITYGLSYSLDMLIPMVDLWEKHKGVNLAPVVRHYFYFHQIMGWVLVSFGIAGLTGLTKK